MELKARSIALVLAWTAATTGFAQHPDPAFDHYNVEDGLSQSTVWSIFEDSKGFIWFCTPDGLNKFDGYTFKVYRNDRRDSTSIKNNHAVALFEDSAGDLWIGHGGGLSKYLYGQDRFALVYSMSKVNAEDDGLLPLHESDGIVWAWDRNRGIAGFDRSTMKEVKLHGLPNGLDEIAASRFARTISNKAFIATTSDLFIIFDFATSKFEFMKTAAASKFAIDSSGTLWIPGYDEVVSMDPISLKTKTHKSISKGKYLTSSTFDTNGLLWLGSVTDGLFVFDQTKGSVSNISKQIHRENGLLYNYIESLFTDTGGNIWIGTNGFGFQKYSRHKNKFDHFDLKIGTNSFGANLVKSIVEGDNGRLYVGTFGNGLYAIEKNGVTKNFTVPGRNNATGLVITPDGSVLISNDYGLFTLSGQSVKPLLIDGARPPMNTTCMLRNGSAILIANEAGVSRISKKGNGYAVTKTWPISGRLTSVLYTDRRDRLWIGTQRSFYIVEKDGKLTGPMEHVTKNFVKSFSEDDDGNVWIATLGDVVRYDPQTENIRTLNEKDGFKNTFFYAALPGNDGRIWISSNQGLASLDPVNSSIRNFTVLDGLQSNEFNTGAFCKLRDGRLAFGGLNGLNVFDPTAIKENPNIPKIAFTDFMVEDKPHQLDTSIVMKKLIELPHSQNTISFEFAALEFTSPENNQYSYMLKGQDKDWVMGGNRRFVRYSKLSPGTYNFSVKASNSDGVWNEKPISVAVVIHPPIYLQAWFIWLAGIFSVVLIAALSILVVRIRYRSQLRKLEVDRKVQQERERISRDLHDHVGSQLTYIINQLDGGQTEVSTTKHLADARDAARTTMGNLRETIWALQREAIMLVDFTDRVKEFAQKQLSSRQGMKLDFTEKIDADYEINPAKALNLFRIAQEVINNSVKHSDGTTLSISIGTVVHAGNAFLKMTIADNGKGFHQNGQHGNGLPNIRFRAGEIHAELSISSRPAKGTTVTVQSAF